MDAPGGPPAGTGAEELLALTAELIDIPSPSRDETAIVAHIETRLRAVPWLGVDRVGDNLVARTDLGRAQRVLLAGHTDTVPANGNERAVREGDRVAGLGASDMKGGLAVMLALATTVDAPVVDVTYVFYAREEIAAAESGLLELATARADLLAADVAILGEPTGASIEAGCQGTLRLEVELVGERAHTARPWMGRNAVHRLGRLLAVVDAWPGREPEIDGCTYREALQAVLVAGGVAANVVPDRATVTLNHRFAPDRTPEQAETFVRELLAPVLEPDDTVRVVDVAAGAPPGLTHPLLQSLVEDNGLAVSAKYGWTDVARFAALGVPSTNFGPGDSALAHTAGEWVDGPALVRVHDALRRLLTGAGVPPAPRR